MKQIGRSMIEMLGVLAIIGVLSIGGIALYRRAVNNHHANVILDDANRLAFVITERGNFAPNDNIEGIEFNQTSTYSIVPFVGASAGQYGIMVENVPKGVCEPLVDKASVEYKVRVMPYQSTEYIDQIANTGLVYDSYHKDICINDVNDVVLFFGDTSGQCNKPEEGQDGIPCIDNKDCCGTHFCAFQSTFGRLKQGIGICLSIDTFGPGTKTITINGIPSTWTYSTKKYKDTYHMTWWSLQNWCKAQGKSMLNRVDIGCEDIDSDDTICPAVEGKWTYTGCYWLNDDAGDGYKYMVCFNSAKIHIKPQSQGSIGFCK